MNPFGTAENKIDEKNCRLQHRPREAIQAAGVVAGVLGLQRRKLSGKRDSRIASSFFLGAWIASIALIALWSVSMGLCVAVLPFTKPS